MLDFVLAGLAMIVAIVGLLTLAAWLIERVFDGLD